MDLWIRSQDRTKLVKADNISYMDTAEDYKKEVHSLWNDCKGILGTYKTKERALEVLDEIQNILFPKFKVDTSSIKENGRSWVENGVILQSYTANVDYIKLDTCVYEMPKE